MTHVPPRAISRICAEHSRAHPLGCVPSSLSDDLNRSARGFAGGQLPVRGAQGLPTSGASRLRVAAHAACDRRDRRVAASASTRSPRPIVDREPRRWRGAPRGGACCRQ